MEVRAIVLAAGKGTRMNSDLPKCAHTIIDKAMINYVVDSLNKVGISKIVTVLGYGREKMEELLIGRSKFSYQEEQLGTAHAVMTARGLFEDYEGLTLIAIGDMPRVTAATYKALVEDHRMSGSDLTVLSTKHPTPFGYGRVVRNKETGELFGVVEERDCTDEERLINEINASIYVVDNQKLFASLNEVGNKNKQNEYYLTDIIKVFRNKNFKVSAFTSTNHKEISGVNDKYQLMKMEEELQEEIIKRHLLEGVSIHNPSSITIGEDAQIEGGAVILNGSIITGRSVIYKDAIIGPHTLINNSRIGVAAEVRFSLVRDSIIKENEKVGPYKNVQNRE